VRQRGSPSRLVERGLRWWLGVPLVHLGRTGYGNQWHARRSGEVTEDTRRSFRAMRALDTQFVAARVARGTLSDEMDPLPQRTEPSTVAFIDADPDGLGNHRLNPKCCSPLGSVSRSREDGGMDVGEEDLRARRGEVFIAGSLLGIILLAGRVSTAEGGLAFIFFQYGVLLRVAGVRIQPAWAIAAAHALLWLVAMSQNPSDLLASNLMLVLAIGGSVGGYQLGVRRFPTPRRAQRARARKEVHATRTGTRREGRSFGR
jgi:hypothetical protein